MAIIPVRYIPKMLTRRDKKRQRRELKKSRRAYKSGKYYTRKRVSSFKGQTSPHVVKARKLYKIDILFILTMSDTNYLKYSS